MLGIVLKLGHVGRAIRRSEQVGLRSSSEPAQVLDSGDASGHRHLLELTVSGSTERESEGWDARERREQAALLAAWRCSFERDYNLLQGLEVVHLVERTQFQRPENGRESC